MAAISQARPVASAVLLIALLLQLGCAWRFRVAKAKAYLRKLESAETAFRAKNGRFGSFEELAAAGEITGELAKGVADGYRFEVRVKNNSYEALAIPKKSIDKDLPAYFLDQSGVLRQNHKDTEATVNDPLAPET